MATKAFLDFATKTEASLYGTDFLVGYDGSTKDECKVSVLELLYSIGIPAGFVLPFAGSVQPRGWVKCDGSYYDPNNSMYNPLFKVIGTTYGSRSTDSFFKVPDLRGYFVRGCGTNEDGTSSLALGVKQADNFAQHTHIASATPIISTQGTNHNNAASAKATATKAFEINDGKGTPIYNVPGIDIGVKVFNAATGGSETRPKNIALWYYIKL